MTILSELRAEVQAVWQRSPTQTVLWLDPQHEWERLLDQLAAELELVKYAGSQLELRVKIELEPAQQPRLVYVPLPRQALSVLKEYEFTLPLWDEALLHALRRWGVGIERDEEKSLLPLLPGLAARWSDRPKEDWRHLTASGVRARLFDDEQVRDLALWYSPGCKIIVLSTAYVNRSTCQSPEKRVQRCARLLRSHSTSPM